MAKYKNRIAALIGAGALIALAATDIAGAASVNFNHAAFAATGSSATSIPIGHAEFCKKYSSECRANPKIVDAMALTDSRWQELLAVNSTYNSKIVGVTDQQLYKVEEYWTYPNGYGDCEDYVLAKRKDLISKGWAPSTLLIAVVRQANGEGHAVLMARTDRGDLILDNQEGLIKVWNETPYRYIKRQSQANAGKWVDVQDNRTALTASR